MKSFKGVWTALVTPFDPKGKIDEAAFCSLIERQGKAGITGIVPCGTTGESPTLSRFEKERLISLALEEGKKSNLKVMAGTGSNNTAESIEFSKWASEKGADAVLLVTPYYNKPSQRGLIAHFTAIADAISCPAIIYQVPGRTITSIEPATVVELAKHPKIAGIKDATADMTYFSRVQEEFEKNGGTKDFIFLSGDDLTYLSYLWNGGHGIISVASNLIPKELNEFLTLVENKERDKALQLHGKFYPFFRSLFLESNPGPIKAAMAEKKLCSDHLRLPLVPMSPENKKLLLAVLP